jgi:tetratricopeptide (TPR) repeat protein
MGNLCDPQFGAQPYAGDRCPLRRVCIIKSIFLLSLASLVFAIKLGAEQKDSFEQYRGTAAAAEKDGRFLEAEENYKSAESLGATFKRKDPRLFYVQRDMAAFYEARKRPIEAEQYYCKALDSAAYLAEHSDDPIFRPNRYLMLCRMQERAGDFCFNNKKLAEAEESYRGALSSADLASKDQLKPRSNDEWMGAMVGMLAKGKGLAADPARLNEKLALVYTAEGKVEEAKVLDQRTSQERQKRSFEPLDSDEQEKAKLAFGEMSGKNYASAIDHYQGILAEAEHRHGPGDPRVGSLLNDLGVAMMLAGNYAEAESVFQRSLRVYEHARGPASPSSVSTLENYSRMLRRAGRSEEADRIAADAVAIQRKPATPIPPH